MKKSLRGKLTYANVISSLCLFLLVAGGTAFAAGQLGKNTVGSKQLKKNAVTSAKIKKDAVTGAKIKESSLGAVPNASKLGGVAASGFLKSDGVQAFGEVSAKDIDNFTSKDFTPIISKSFNAPSNGFLLIVGSVSAANDGSIGGQNELFFRLALDGVPETTDPFFHGISPGVGEEEANTGAATAVVPVNAGAHTASIEAREELTGSYIFGRDLSILFVPSGSGVTFPVAP